MLRLPGREVLGPIAPGERRRRVLAVVGRVRVARAEETSLKMTSACEQALREKDEALGTLEAVQGLYEADRAKTNSARKKVDSIRKDMAKVFRVCGAKSLEEVEAVVRERREFQVQVLTRD